MTTSMSSTTERSFSRVESAVQIRFRPGSLPAAEATAAVVDDVEAEAAFPDEEAGLPAGAAVLAAVAATVAVLIVGCRGCYGVFYW